MSIVLKMYGSCIYKKLKKLDLVTGVATKEDSAEVASKERNPLYPVPCLMDAKTLEEIYRNVAKRN